MYKISVLAMFKNESMIIKDWIEHYLREGVEHFYLIDNGSTDDYYEKIKIYDNYITLTKDPTRLPKGTQTFLFNKIYLQKIKKESEWIIICDIDEYIYARNGFNQIMTVLDRFSSNVEKIWLPWKCFGSNGNKNQPNNIIKSFTKRKEGYTKNDGFGKIICRTANLKGIETCGHVVSLSKNNILYNANGQKLENFNLDEENCQNLNLHLNHYMLMSEEYYQKIKCTRGGGESGISGKYSIGFFHNFDKRYNILNDNELSYKKYTSTNNNTSNNNTSNNNNLLNNNIFSNISNNISNNLSNNKSSNISNNNTANSIKWYAYKKDWTIINHSQIKANNNIFIKKYKDIHSNDLDNNSKKKILKNTILNLDNIQDDNLYFIVQI